MHPFTLRSVALIVLAAIGLQALEYLTEALPVPGPWLWLLLVLLGPLATGVVFGYLRKPWQLAAAAWALAGIFSLLTDWILLNEDQLFHLALTIVWVVLVAIGTAIGWGIRRRLRPDTAARTPVR